MPLVAGVDYVTLFRRLPLLPITSEDHFLRAQDMLAWFDDRTAMSESALNYKAILQMTVKAYQQDMVRIAGEIVWTERDPDGNIVSTPALDPNPEPPAVPPEVDSSSGLIVAPAWDDKPTKGAKKK